MSTATDQASTFLFTDIEGSTRLWSHAPDAMAAAVPRQEALLRRIIAGEGGTVFKTVGDGVYAIFSLAPDAVRAAVAAQRALLAEPWGGFDADNPLRVRIAVHSGPAEARDDDFLGPTLNQLSRTLAAGHGGQVLCTGETRDACGGDWPDGIGWRDLGERTLRDVPGRGRILQLTAPGLPEHFPPLLTLDRRAHNLPRWPSHMVGRERDAERLRAALRSREARMVSVLGTGGVGKTRLTTEVAAQMLDEFQHGIRFVDLSALRDASQVVPAIVQATGANDPLLPAKDAVLEWLQDRELLVVLDNCEQVVAGVAAICSEIVASAPNVTLLATSRTPIRIRGERQLALEPLPLPGDDADLLTDNSSVTLFAQRARDVNESFVLDAASAVEIADICRMVDGLPLAIELAAAWVRILSPAALQRRLQEGRGILRDGARDLPDRQRTLASTIAWSYDLLPPEDQRAFRRLAVFRGGIAVDAAAAVIWEEPVTDPLWALSRLDALVQANLLQVAPDHASEPRFVMLQTIQEFAIGVLRDSGEWEESARAHAEFFSGLADEAHPHYRTADSVDWLDKLDSEFENLRAAVEFDIADPARNEHALRFVVSLSGFLDHRCHFSEARKWFDRIYRDDAEYPPELRVDALFHQGNTWFSDPAIAGAFYRRAIAVADATRDANLRIRPIASLSVVASLNGDHQTAMAMAREVLKHGQQESDLSYEALGFVRLAQVASEASLFDEALLASAEARTRLRMLADPDGEAWTWLGDGRVYRRLAEPNAAQNALDHAFARFQEVGDAEAMGACYLERGLSLLGADPALARWSIDQAVARLATVNDAYWMIALIEASARLLILERNTRVAAELIGAARTMRARTGIVPSARDATALQSAIDQAISLAGRDTFDEHAERGLSHTPRAAMNRFMGASAPRSAEARVPS